MLFPVNKLIELNKKYALPQPAPDDFKRWVKYKEENLFKPVLVYCGNGLYFTCDCNEVWGLDVIYQNENGKEYLIVKDLEAVTSRIDDIVIVNDGRIVHVLRQYRPGIEFFHLYTACDTSPELVKKSVGCSDVYIVKGFNELMNVARSEFDKGIRQRFLIVEEI